MIIQETDLDFAFNSIRVSTSWNSVAEKELKMHKIHAYPAKFPSFLINKALEYAEQKKISIEKLGDIFCGCGTTALEAKTQNISFWGCDINPVATLIAKVKSQDYNLNILSRHYNSIVNQYKFFDSTIPRKFSTNERLNYWFTENQLLDVYKLLYSIETCVAKGKYRDFFYVAFSNILKRSSKWLTKSIKPQVDPIKPIYNVLDSFNIQYEFMYKAVFELKKFKMLRSESQIVNSNFLSVDANGLEVDMLITSPPYVTSYEYADLHQLSTMWLGYTDDFRLLRNGTIGSLYHNEILQAEISKLDDFAINIYDDLVKAKAKSPKAALKYFIDLKNTVEKSFDIIKAGGLAVFVIGNTNHKNVYIDNAKYLTKCLFTQGFVNVEIKKRRISSKILSPYRTKDGKFSSNKRHKKVYHYEFVIIAQKPTIN
ncbi:DNA methyltransferase [Flavobacterium silvaticum]|uniref:site-specific DNA-methyltransferase (cytosine-N(4)-specific) n=1 Tax=Flavobacterium silvaticum TaxID=1852020 RepID=A0A972JK34_9FLAO|nr:DNA methyltransferase [Flavobacterium silvaticum]NMH28722.1 site-specific DNA-methyltransferase [Flavobacterium silvaticum]